VLGEFAKIEEAERQAAASVTMLALVNRTQSRPEITESAFSQPSPKRTA